MLRRTDSFELVCFLCAFLSRISRAETVKWALLQTNNFFQFSDKKGTCLTPTQISFRNFREIELIIFEIEFLSNFSKRNIFVHSKANLFYLILEFLKECDTFESSSVFFFFLSCSLQPTKSWFVSLKAISNRDLQTIHHPSMNYWFQYCDLH